MVGSHGRHGLALLLGSTANDVLHGAPCDVLAVRLKTKADNTSCRSELLARVSTIAIDSRLVIASKPLPQ